MSDSAEAVPVPRYDDVLDAARRIAGVAYRTPLIEAPTLGDLTGARILIKAEMLQRTGAFKFRGAWNRISRLDDAGRTAGVVTFSSGNHGQAVAAAARHAGIRATVVMPRTAPAIKIDSTRRHGADVVLYDPETESRESIAADIAERSGAILVPPYDDPRIIAGQGTVGLEIADDAASLGATIDVALVPVSGGGLIAGTAIALRERFPAIEIHAVEPEGFDDTARSLAAGRRETNVAGRETFCDALRVPTPGEITFAINRRLLAGGVAVADDRTAAAMRAAFRHLKLVCEPAGAIALAAALDGLVPIRGRTVAIVCSGGNVDPATYAEVISRPD